MKRIVLLYILLLAFGVANSQMVTGVWRGTITKGSGLFAKSMKLEVKLIKKGDSLLGTSYYYVSPKMYMRYSVFGYFDVPSNTVRWQDHAFLTSVPEHKAEDPDVVKDPMKSTTDFNCPNPNGVMKLDGFSEVGEGELYTTHLTKVSRSLFPDEWDDVIKGYTSGMAHPDIIDSVWAIASVPKKRPDIAKNDKLPPKASSENPGTGKNAEPVAAIPPATNPNAEATAARTKAGEKAKEEAIAKATAQAEEKAKLEEIARAMEEAEAKAKQETIAKAKEDADEKAKTDAIAKAKEDAELKAREETVARAKAEADEKAKTDAIAKAKEDAELKAREETLAKAKAEADEIARQEELVKAKAAADAKAKQDVLVRAKAAEDKALKEAIAKEKAQAAEKERQAATAKAATPNNEKSSKQEANPAAAKEVVTTTPAATVATPSKPPVALQPEIRDPDALQKFVTRRKVQQGEIPIEGDSIELHFYDNAEVDGDSISLFVNGKLMFNHVLLSTKDYVFKLGVKDLPDDSELAMVAENLGTIPPNTALMIAYVKGERYQIRLESTEQTSGTIKLVRR